MNSTLKMTGLGLATMLLGAQAQASQADATAQSASVAQTAPAVQSASTTQAAPGSNRATHPTQTAGAIDPRDDPDRLICRSIAETGSLVRRKRQCFTRAQWDRINEGGRNQALHVTGALPSGQINN